MSSEDGRGSGDRRIGDATLKRIDQLADGWKSPTSAPEGAESDSTPGGEPASKPSETDDSGTPPPTPPGPRKRSKRESDLSVPIPVPEPAGKRGPPGPAPAPPRAKRGSRPPPPPGSSARSKTGAALTIETSSPRGGDSTEEPTTTWDDRSSGGTAVPRKKAGTGPPPPPGSPARATAPTPLPAEGAALGSVSGPLAARSGEVEVDVDLDTPAPAPVPQSQLRMPTAMPRSRGPLADIRYAIRQSLSVRSTRRDLEATQLKLRAERKERLDRLVDIARLAVGDDTVDHPAVAAARDELAEIEDRRSQMAGVVAASESEIDALEGERRQLADQLTEDLAATDRDLAALDSQLTPVETAMADARKRVSKLKASMAELDDRLQAAEARLVAASSPDDGAAIEAEIAGLRADRDEFTREEPMLLGQVAELEPQIARLSADRAEVEARREQLRERADEQNKRVDEKIHAIRARKAVDDREVQDVTREQRAALEDLGRILAEERPASVSLHMRGVDQHDETIRTLERRSIELKDRLLRTDRGAVVRGFVYLGVVASALIAGGVAAVLLM